MSEPVSLLLSLCLIGAALTLITGFYSLLMTRNLIRTLIAVEILSKGIQLLIIACGYAVGQIALAQALVITLIVVEVAVIVVAVGIVLCIYRHTESLDSAQIRSLKG